MVVQNGSCRLARFPRLDSDSSAQHIVDDLPITLPAPEPEIMVDRLPRAEITGQQAPGAACSDKIEQRVANPTQNCLRPLMMLSSPTCRQYHFPPLPWSQAQAGWIERFLIRAT